MEVLSRYIIMEMAFMSFFSNRRQPEPESLSRSTEKPTVAQPAALPAPPTNGFESILGAHSTMEGKLESHANIRLDGIFTGSLQIIGNVLVGETAQITADINAHNISIAGSVKGNVNGQKVQLLRSGRVVGDIHAVLLTMEEGAFLDGKISMITVEPEVIEPDDSSDEPEFLEEVIEDNIEPVESNESDEDLF